MDKLTPQSEVAKNIKLISALFIIILSFFNWYIYKKSAIKIIAFSVEIKIKLNKLNYG